MTPYGRYSIRRRDFKLKKNELNSEWLTIRPMVDAFESKISNLIGAAFVVTSGTATS